MKNYKQILFLIFLLIFGSGLNSYAQTIPVACGNDLVRYGVGGDNGNSDFFWTVEGGTVETRYDKGDSVEIRWNSVAGAHIITVIERNLFGCEGEPYQETIMVSTPFIDLGVDIEMCQNETETFNVGSEEFTSYLWQDNSVGETFIASAGGDFWVRVTDIDGCQATDSVAVILHELPIVDLGSDTTLCDPNDALILDPSDWGYNFLWSDNSITPTMDVTTKIEDQEFWVTVTNEYNCEGTDTIVIRFCGELEIPNVFTPNGDYTNDVWEIAQLYVFEDLTLDIFDRFGNRVFHSDGYSSENYWNGTNQKGKKLPMDAYYYVIDLHNGEQPIVGNVTLVR
ncbi:MAG: T9SS type B sorting domain-containing protein [Bacteroidales bacterium]|nr:T9SS type B sorting domain-containing protein [Bacteroidales bacterium]